MLTLASFKQPCASIDSLAQTEHYLTPSSSKQSPEPGCICSIWFPLVLKLVFVCSRICQQVTILM